MKPFCFTPKWGKEIKTNSHQNSIYWAQHSPPSLQDNSYFSLPLSFCNHQNGPLEEAKESKSKSKTATTISTHSFKAQTQALEWRSLPPYYSHKRIRNLFFNHQCNMPLMTGEKSPWTASCDWTTAPIHSLGTSSCQTSSNSALHEIWEKLLWKYCNSLRWNNLSIQSFVCWPNIFLQVINVNKTYGIRIWNLYHKMPHETKCGIKMPHKYNKGHLLNLWEPPLKSIRITSKSHIAWWSDNIILPDSKRREI